jgi:hypothetical protein
MMKSASKRFWIQFVCLCLILTGRAAAADDELPPGIAQDLMGTPPGGQRSVVGLSDSNCIDCHGGSKPASDRDLVSDIGNRSRDGWILGDEIKTWKAHDPHHQAFAVLVSDQSRQIAKHLGIVDKSGKSLVHRDRRCLSCHSSIPVEQMEPLEGDLVREETDRNPLYTVGVSCEACHGPAGKNGSGKEGWGSAHARSYDPKDTASWWRAVGSKRKFVEFGYWDIHSPRTQTRICLSCHMGNVEQQKIITHEMYAAGHPPLPSFELSQFVHQMPRHWRRLDEKNEPLNEIYKPRDQNYETVRDEFVGLRNQHKAVGEEALSFDPQNDPVTKATMIAALVTLEESMTLTAALIDRSATAAAASIEPTPELANYACYACHHELQRDGWRQRRQLTAAPGSSTSVPGRPTLVPGRPTLHEWPFALSRVVVATEEEEEVRKQFQLEIDNISRVVNSRPFGTLSELRHAAAALARLANERSQQLSPTGVTINCDRTREFLKTLVETASTSDMDYDSARQFAWAYERSNANLEAMAGRVGKHEPPAASVVPTEWGNGNAVLKGLDGSLILFLRPHREAGQSVELFLGKAPLAGRTVRPVDFGKSLKQTGAFQPDLIRAEFQKLSAGMEKPQPTSPAANPPLN